MADAGLARSGVVHDWPASDLLRGPDVLLVLGLCPGEPVPAHRIEVVKMGTTVATNALLERKGEPVALVTNRGLGDVLRIGSQQRPHLFDLRIVLPEPLYARAIEVPGRVAADGTELEPLELEPARRELAQAFQDGIRALAIDGVLDPRLWSSGRQIRSDQVATQAEFH